MNISDVIWAEKYRPKNLDDVILPERTIETFKGFVKNGSLPNLLLYGPAGVGKTTVAKAVLNELNCEYMIINGSMKGTIDTLRNDILNFSSSMAMNGKRKYVILDEADYLTQLVQASLRNFMEEYSANCGFILTCNYKNKIIQPLHSRCSVIDFSIKNEEKEKICVKFLKRIIQILTNENITYDKHVVAAIVTKYFPDWRRVLNELQGYSSKNNCIDEGILSTIENTSLNEIMELCKKKNFDGIRKWVSSKTIDATTVFSNVYEQSKKYVKPSSIPELIVIIADYQYKSAFVANQEINLMAFFVEISMRCEFQ